MFAELQSVIQLAVRFAREFSSESPSWISSSKKTSPTLVPVMPADFSRTTHALEKERLRVFRFVAVAMVMAFAWGWWLTQSRVAVYHSTRVARIEVESAAHAIASEVTGRVVHATLKVGTAVNAGDVLVELDATLEKQSCLEARLRQQIHLATQRELLIEIAAEEEALSLASSARAAALGESDSLIDEALARQLLAQKEATMSSQLRSHQAVSELEFQRTLAEAKAQEATVASERSSRIKTDQDWALSVQERRVRLAQLRRQANEAGGAAELEAAAVSRLEHSIRQRSIVAPISGKLGNVAEIHPGAVVSAAQVLATVIPIDKPRAVAFYPAQSVGLLKPNQSGSMRLDGYAWMQFGAVPAVVRSVGSEPNDGLIRVELELRPPRDCPIPLTHGLPGSLDIQVERVAPVTLVLRAAGQYLAPRKQGTAPVSIAYSNLDKSGGTATQGAAFASVELTP